MVAFESFSRAVAAVYAAATTADAWAEAIKQINRAIGGNGGALLSATDQIWCIDDGVLPDEAATSYADYYCHLDHTLAPVRSGPVGKVWTGHQLVAPYRNTEFYDGWLHRFDIEDAMFVRVTDHPAPVCLIVHAGRMSQPLDSPDSESAMGALVPHLQQALVMRQRLAALTDRHRDVVTALDAMKHGVVIVGADTKVVDLNRAAKAVVDTHDGISLHSSHIRAHDPSVNHRLQRAVIAALGDGGIPAGHTITCTRPSGKRPFVIQVAPLRTDRTDGAPGAKALITITDPDRGPVPLAASLFRHYGLTTAEAQIAERIARGARPKQIADELSVSIDTVRTHLRHVFQKTNTHRQSELVRLLLSTTN